MGWDEMFSGKSFISDLGKEQEIEGENGTVVLNRFAAWMPLPGGKSHQIVEISDNCEFLREKYGVPHDRVCTLA